MTGICENERKHIDAAKRARAVGSVSETVDMAKIFHTLSDLGRLKIVLALMQGDMCVYHLTEVCGGSQSGISHQLRVWRENGIVRAKRVGKTVEYALVDEHVREMVALCQTHTHCENGEGLQ